MTRLFKALAQSNLINEENLSDLKDYKIFTVNKDVYKALIKEGSIEFEEYFHPPFDKCWIQFEVPDSIEPDSGEIINKDGYLVERVFMEQDPEEVYFLIRNFYGNSRFVGTDGCYLITRFDGKKVQLGTFDRDGFYPEPVTNQPVFIYGKLLALLFKWVYDNRCKAKYSLNKKLVLRNQKRKVIGISSQKVCKISPYLDNVENNGDSSNRNSPREHIRRGHFRQVRGKKIWIKGSVVNKGCKYKIEKRYNLTN